MGRASERRSSRRMFMLGSNSSLSNAFTDFVDNCGMELFGCDENCAASRKVLGAALQLEKNPAKVNRNEPNYAALHDEFLESLLYEQTKAARELQEQEEAIEVASAPTAAFSRHYESDSSPSSSTPRRKRRRKHIRLHKRSGPPKLRGAHVAPLSDANSIKTVQLRKLSKSGFQEDPASYLHPQCRMQKDKGKGEAVGSKICAKGRDACLEKLRVKIGLLTEVVLDSNKGQATMKRKKAKVAEDYENFTETRSLIELRMGFLSMTYGVLLRWDTGRTGKVTLVVLRKMCHESFYPARTRQPAEPKWASTLPPDPIPHARDVIEDKHAILQRHDGTEIALIEPPYRVERPAFFEPTVLSASVLFATGLSRKSNWTVKLIYDDHSENILLSWDDDQRCMVPRLGEPLKHTISNLTLSSLEIRLYEHRLRHRGYRRLISTMHVPLNNLDPQPSSSSKPAQLMIPCKHDPDSAIALSLMLRSDYAHWLNKELEVRRRDEVTGFVWRSPFRYSEIEKNEDEENQDPWDWICSIC